MEKSVSGVPYRSKAAEGSSTGASKVGVSNEGGAGGRGDGALSSGRSMRKTSPQEEHRALTPPRGVLLESTGKSVEQDGHLTVMTMTSFLWVAAWGGYADVSGLA